MNKIIYTERIHTEQEAVFAWLDQLQKTISSKKKLKAECYMSYNILKNGDAEIIYEFFNVKSA